MRRYRVLIADSDEPLLETYRAFLAKEGFFVKTAPTALGCLTRLRAWVPEVLVLEAALKWGAAEGILTLMAEGEVPRIPVIVLADSHDPDLWSRFAAFSVGEHHVKPLLPAKLAELIRGILGVPPQPEAFVNEWA
jgi:DNA-binding NtrC family response regulator